MLTKQRRELEKTGFWGEKDNQKYLPVWNIPLTDPGKTILPVMTALGTLGSTSPIAFDERENTEQLFSIFP